MQNELETFKKMQYNLCSAWIISKQSRLWIANTFKKNSMQIEGKSADLIDVPLFWLADPLYYMAESWKLQHKEVGWRANRDSELRLSGLKRIKIFHKQN